MPSLASKKSTGLSDAMKAQKAATQAEVKKETPSTSTLPNSDMKRISAYVNKEQYAAFTQTNKSRGVSNNSVLNMLISDYVQAHKAQ